MSPSSSFTSSGPRLPEDSLAGGSPSENFSSSFEVSSSSCPFERTIISEASRPDVQASGPTEESSILHVSPGSYVPRKPSSHTSGCRRLADNVADARCEIESETFKWIRNHLGLVLLEHSTVYANKHLRAHYSMENGVCLYSEAVRSVVGFLAACALAEVLPTTRLCFYCFSVKAFGDWLYFAARSGRQILGRIPSSIPNWKRNFVFIHCPSGWPFPTTWSAINIRYKAFRSPNLVESELWEFEPLQALEPSEKLFELIAEAERAMADKGTSLAPPARKSVGPSLAEVAERELMSSRGKKKVSRGAKRARPTETEVPIVAPDSAPLKEQRIPETTGLSKRPRPSADRSVDVTTSVASQLRSSGHTGGLSAIEWGRQVLSAEAKVPTSGVRSSQIIEDFYSSVQGVMAQFKGILYRVETSRASAKARLIEVGRKLVAEKDLRAKEAERANKAEARADKLLNWWPTSVQKAIVEAVAEYRESDELKAEVVKLFRQGYDFCLKHVREHFPNIDVSKVVLDEEDDEKADDDNQDESIAAVVNDALATAVEGILEANVDDIIAGQPTVPVSEETHFGSGDVVSDLAAPSRRYRPSVLDECLSDLVQRTTTSISCAEETMLENLGSAHAEVTTEVLLAECPPRGLGGETLRRSCQSLAEQNGLAWGRTAYLRLWSIMAIVVFTATVINPVISEHYFIRVVRHVTNAPGSTSSAPSSTSASSEEEFVADLKRSARGATRDKYLGGLLAADFDETTCLSRFQSAMYRKRSPHKPSRQLVRRLRRYEEHHRRCAPHTVLYNRTLQLVGVEASPETEPDCQYIVWAAYCGLGNRMLSLVSTFLYALLTDRVLLVDPGQDLPGLFCEPFPDTTWLVPPDFPIPKLEEFGRRNKDSYVRLLHKKKIAAGRSPPPFVYIHLGDDYDVEEMHFFCESDQAALQKVPWLLLRTDLYLVPAFFLNRDFEPELTRLFPETETVFHHLGRYLFHPTDKVWGMITRYYRGYLAAARERLGVQIRIFDDKDAPFEVVSEQVINCLHKEKLLAGVDTNASSSAGATAADPKKTTVVLLTSLHTGYLEKIREMYWMHPAAGGAVVSVHQPTHEEWQQTGKESHDEKAWAEISLLSFADVLVTSARSTFGYIAQGLAGIKPWVLMEVKKGKIPEPTCVREASMEPCFLKATWYVCREKRNGDNGKVLPYVRHCLDFGFGIKLFDRN
ncbi:hypothetical protein Taro_039589 [Colocasia esculenta]|uniref:Fucosyltransferase n=1 Tax=Colocasia esculenta TaxID=4460 RepID=A0A843WMP0_COLES|nr:hypothetical protein [Colocasia esculenta]